MNLISFSEVPVVWAEEIFTLKLQEGRPYELSWKKPKPWTPDSDFWTRELLSSLLGGCDYFPQQGSEFQRQVWREISKIPWGETRTYGEIACNLKRPKAYRAVAQACSQNPLPLFIPCHRVVGKSDLGGFNGGVELKRKLLRLEGHDI